MAGATADLPEKGGLDPSLGIDLHYFTGPDGFSRPMIPEPANRLRWADGMTVLKDGAGKEILVGRNSIMKSLGECVGMQLIIYNDSIDSIRRFEGNPQRRSASADGASDPRGGGWGKLVLLRRHGPDRALPGGFGTFQGFIDV